MGYIIDHEDIWIESEKTLSWLQVFDENLGYENLSINQKDYHAYQPTRLQFHLNSADITQSIKVKIKYANRLTRTHVKHAVICRYNQDLREWEMISHTLNKEEKVFEFEANIIGVYCVFVNHYWYSSFTQRMADEYPNWTKIRQSKKSTGQLFLNYFGIELETVKDYLEWIQEQKYIGTADISSYDWIYMYKLPNINQTNVIKITSADGKELPVLESLQEFFYNDRNQGGILDYEEGRFYTSRKYGDLIFTISRGEEENKYQVTPLDYHIWNQFDEFGLLLGVTRLHLEKNENYKERILDVFRYPSGTHDEGLTNGIARDLNMIQRRDKTGQQIFWKNDLKDLVLRNSEKKVIEERSLRVDDLPLKKDQYEVDEVGNIRIFAFNEGKEHTISFIHDIEKYQLYDKDYEPLRRMMFQEDGQATPTLLHWVEYINTVAPVMWDRFRWDEGFWDTIDQKLTGLGYVPNIWDSQIDVWKEYEFQSNR